MVCIYCNGKTQVTNSRSSSKKHSTWRRRSCFDCSALFTTKEEVDLESTIRVKTKSGNLAPFNRDSLFLSIHGSVSHRDTAATDAAGLTATITNSLMYDAHKGVIETYSIVATALEVLRRFDSVAATYYNARH